MAHFYGVLSGGRGEATRTGTKNSGLTATAASWNGAVTTQLYEKNGHDFARVTLGQWRSRGQSPARVLYDGRIDGQDTPPAE